jgi:hypothetical protein
VRETRSFPFVGVWGRSVRQHGVEAVGDVQQSRGGSGETGYAVLPHQGPSGRVDAHHAITEIVVGHERAAWEPLNQ